MMTVSNSRSISNWSPEKGYEKGLRSEEYPYRVFNAKQGAALFIVMSLSVEDFNYMCIGPIQGFKVTLTMPGERQKVLSRFFEILNSEKSEILVKPKMVMTSNILRHYSPRQRQCFYQSERQLHFFKIYTQNNCEEECLANFTRNECDCVNFSMPRDKKTKICGVANIDCYKNATKKFFGEDELESDKVKEFRAKCKCLASCQYIKYDADIDRTRFQASLLSVSFADHEVTTLQRSETSTYNDFLATCGGLLGLFLGVSVLSVIEFIYYCTLRLFWTVWPIMGNLWSRISNLDMNKDEKVDVESNESSSPNDESSPILKLNVDFFHEIFELILLYDLLSIGKTCKRLQKLAGDFYRMKYVWNKAYTLHSKSSGTF
ncbi:pickpocket protein 28-like [Contarinia nasturtii]|uniref:pickpocket protein 28-like n=1 Tax=Contarinia nasturtii TaxID=265458 RepID=UPI0012D3E051|nr:pickpocket protein 28-like [Contarinia nasturtii]